jgi:hypothetical protein
MSSEKQVLANQKNALLSTGPTTEEGKSIVAKNAIRHGILSRDLIVSSTLGKENEGEYQEMLNSLIDCLAPQNQIESLLVEKIAIDFWRLRRVIRFEAGSIGKYLETLFKDFYSFGKKGNKGIDQEILYKKRCIEWNSSYIACLKKEEVSFDQPLWKGDGIESDIIEDFYLIAKNSDSIPRVEKDRLYSGSPSFPEMKAILARNGYPSKTEISATLIELYIQQNQRLEKEIKDLEQSKLDNNIADELTRMLATLPQEENTDKIMKYERSLQKSIYQNLFLLKKLQGLF